MELHSGKRNFAEFPFYKEGLDKYERSKKIASNRCINSKQPVCLIEWKNNSSLIPSATPATGINLKQTGNT